MRIQAEVGGGTVVRSGQDLHAQFPWSTVGERPGQRATSPLTGHLPSAPARPANKLGTIEDIYLDQETGEAEWVALKTGMFGGKLSFAPLAQARQDGDTIVLPYEKEQIKKAPRVEADGALSQEEEAELYRHYGLDYTETRSDTGLPAGGSEDRDPVGHDVSGPPPTTR
jgi:hypothetical protein